MNRILALLAAIASFAAAISWGGKQKAKAEQANARADISEDILDDVKTAKRITDNLDTDSDERKRVRDKYTRR